MQSMGSLRGQLSRSGAKVGAHVQLVVLAGLALVSACAFKSPPGLPTPEMAMPMVGPEGHYRIRTGDLLDVRFYKTPELNVEKVPVRQDGYISLEILGDVKAAGLEPDELSANLTRDYSRELSDPKITVIVREFGGQVYVGGEVGRPAAIKYADGLTALQAIQSAGGFKDESSRTNVVLIRKGSTRYEGYHLSLQRALSGEDYGQDVALRPDDVVYVPKSRAANVNLIVQQYINKNLPTIPISIPVF